MWRGAPLAEAENWQQQRLEELSPQEQEFIQLSLELQNREKEDKERQRQGIILGLVGGLVVALALAYILHRFKYLN